MTERILAPLGMTGTRIVLRPEDRERLIDFFLKLKSHKLPVSIKEYLTLLEAMGKDVIGPSIDEFYYLSRTALVKDESNYDKFDRAFAEFWQGVETIPGIESEIPLGVDWLPRLTTPGIMSSVAATSTSTVPAAEVIRTRCPSARSRR